MAVVVIPTKSNTAGMTRLVSVLAQAPDVSKVVGVADGPQAVSFLSTLPDVVVCSVPEGAGIHVMWNLGLQLAVEICQPCLFLNDDVDINLGTVKGLANAMSDHPELGLVCPNYSGEVINGPYRSVTDVCGSRYDGTGGMAGFCMMLAADLVPLWRFDENMKWWFGDNDILRWVIALGRVAAICSSSSCSDNDSWTITNDPPPDFYQQVENDRRIYAEKIGLG